MNGYPTDLEELEFHPHWHPCPLCGRLFSDDGKPGYYIDKLGDRVYVSPWYAEGGHTFTEKYYGGEWCRPYKEMPLPSYPWYIKILKNLL